MMKRLAAAAAIIVILCCQMPLRVHACTSFVVYGNETVYGMNWDYPEVPAYIRLYEAEDSHRVFGMNFETEYGMATNASMSDEGFLALAQDLYPAEPTTAVAGDDSIEDIHDLAGWTPFYFEEAAHVRGFIQDTPVGTKYFSLHSLFADKNGDAFILEEREGGITVTDIDGSYMIMSNFPNSVLKEQGMEAVEQLEKNYIHNIGVDRYQTAEAYISENFDSFDVEKGFELLSMTAQYGQYPTQISFVFKPDDAVVYLSFQKNYAQIWKVSIEQGSIETYQGFHKAHQIPLLHEDIPMDELVAYELEDMQSAIQQTDAGQALPDMFLFVCGAVLAIVLIGILFIVRRKRRKKNTPE